MSDIEKDLLRLYGRYGAWRLVVQLVIVLAAWEIVGWANLA